LTGTYADGLGDHQKPTPKRVDFDPFPWQSFRGLDAHPDERWGQIKGGRGLTNRWRSRSISQTDTRKVMTDMGLAPPGDVVQIVPR